MAYDVEALKITPQEIDEMIELNFRNILAIEVYRAVFFRQIKSIISILFNEILAFGLMLIFVAPVSFIMIRNSRQLPEDMSSIAWIVILILGLCLLGLVIGNIYLWQQAKQMKSLVKLLDEVDKYNGVIKALALIDELESIEHSTSQLQLNRLKTRKEVIEALEVTRASLMSALRVEKIMRTHKHLRERRYELLTNLENNLNTLLTFEISDRASEYSQLLHQSLQIGMSVHQEMRRLNKR
jgi:hypothetical protein